jgi:hypothetical protein
MVAKEETCRLLTLIWKRFAVWLPSGKAYVLTTPQILDVFGVIVMKPKGWFIEYRLPEGPPPFKNFILLTVLIRTVFVREAEPAESRTVIIAPGRFKLDNKTT